MMNFSSCFCFYFYFYIFYHIFTCSSRSQGAILASMKNFIVINESFVCEKCGEKNPKLEGSCRNHCRKCLFSLHVDKEIPGDRKSSCHSVMRPISANQNGKKGWMVEHKCEKCGKRIPNKTAPDDNFDEVIILSQL